VSTFWIIVFMAVRYCCLIEAAWAAEAAALDRSASTFAAPISADSTSILLDSSLVSAAFNTSFGPPAKLIPAPAAALAAAAPCENRSGPWYVRWSVGVELPPPLGLLAGGLIDLPPSEGTGCMPFWFEPCWGVGESGFGAGADGLGGSKPFGLLSASLLIS